MSEKLNTCGHCGKKFVSLKEALTHVDKVHRVKDEPTSRINGVIRLIEDQVS